ncbi:MAG: TetR family transcriptional regulator [Ponticaulis sp.]|nr:TetR family transcriptional regulator [Ponticaulis sp.]|tara:strand:- start:60764 stop:61372 length:609 start_codon:yes stop_codon:yes gene_type:complete
MSEDSLYPSQTTKKKKGSSRTKLEAQDWINAALDQLASHGIEGVRVELLAKRLNVTKGSFYWHFKDRDDLHESMLAHWRRRATLALIERLNKSESLPKDRLMKLLRLPIQGKRSAWGADVELAIRLWGKRDHRAAAALKEVDELRTRYITQLFVACGVPPEEAEARANLAYSYMRVAETLIDDNDEDMLARCEALLAGPLKV